MCGIAGQFSLSRTAIPNLSQRLKAMSEVLVHRGPDGDGIWHDERGSSGFVHRRLAIIDLSNSASQPMLGANKTVITYNGEIYNYKELRDSLKTHWQFHSESDTECILAAYERYGPDCLSHLRGMFSFAIWDPRDETLFCARDRFGIKPFYYTVVNDIFYFASEAKALLPFLPEIRTDDGALAEYLTFQYNIGEKTLFKGISQLLPGHALTVKGRDISVFRYWDVNYDIDFDHSPTYFYSKLEELFLESIEKHGCSDVPVGSYVSGGIDSSLIFNLSQKNPSSANIGFHGKFTEFNGYDESFYADAAVNYANGLLHTIDISSRDFSDNFANVIYHLDYPVAGPGSFPQYMVSKLASQHVKVVLGGQGGDEIFGGYARYLLAYFEQCIKAAIDGEYKNGNYVVTIESIVPNLGLLKEYKPLMKKYWSNGLFEPMHHRYFSLIDRSSDMSSEIHWSELDKDSVFSNFASIFNNTSNVKKEAYFDKMTHFDFKCLLPALLQVEDRMSMAHGLESRVPFLDHKLVEFAATIPADIKFKGGNMKYLLKKVFSDSICPQIANRRDKMGFPVPLKEWFEGDLKTYANDMLSTMASKDRYLINSEVIAKGLDSEAQFSRKTWGLLSLEAWYQQFHDRASYWRKLSML